MAVPRTRLLSALPVASYHLRNMNSLLSGSTWAQQLCKAEKALLESADLIGVSCTTADTPITFKGQAQSIHSVYMACDHTVSTVHPEAPMVLMHGFGQVRLHGLDWTRDSFSNRQQNPKNSTHPSTVW